MRLILVDDDGTVLDHTSVTPTQWRQAIRTPEIARMLLEELTPGDEALREDENPATVATSTQTREREQQS